MWGLFSPKETRCDKFPCYKTAAEIWICDAALNFVQLVTSPPFAFYLKAFLHLAVDVTPPCEHCRTSIWNVLWRNPISGFNGSCEAAHPGSREICARVKLVYLINSPIFNYWHYCSACYCFSAQKCIKASLGGQSEPSFEVWRNAKYCGWLI